MLTQKYKQAIQVNKLSKSEMSQTLKISHVKLTTQYIIFTVTWITTTFTASRLPHSTEWENSDTCKLCLNKSTTVYLISVCRPSILLTSQLGAKQPSLFKRGNQMPHCCCFFVVVVVLFLCTHVLFLVSSVTLFPFVVVFIMKALWQSGQCVGLAIRRSRVRFLLQSLAGFVLGRSEFTSLSCLILGRKSFNLTKPYFNTFLSTTWRFCQSHL